MQLLESEQGSCIEQHTLVYMLCLIAVVLTCVSVGVLQGFQEGCCDWGAGQAQLHSQQKGQGNCC
jgi:hypothetical protein